MVCGHCLLTLPLTINETLKWLSLLTVLMQESFWWWQCNDRYLNIYNFPLPPPRYPYPPFSLSLINFMVSVGVKHHVYFTIMTIIIKICMFVFIIGRSCHKYNFCCNKSFIVTNMSFVVTKVCCDKTFVTTKMILVAAPANGMFWASLALF